jgi:hypothetical protein
MCTPPSSKCHGPYEYHLHRQRRGAYTNEHHKVETEPCRLPPAVFCLIVGWLPFHWQAWARALRLPAVPACVLYTHLGATCMHAARLSYHHHATGARLLPAEMGAHPNR